MAVPSSGQLSLYGLAKEKELNNYDNTIPISTYNSFYATPISLGNIATGAGGFDATNLDSAIFPNSTAPHAMSEWYGYDHDYIWIPYYGGNPVNKVASYLAWPYDADSGRDAYQKVRKIGYTSWVADQSNVYLNGLYSNVQSISEVIDFTDWGNDDPFFATNAENQVEQTIFSADAGRVFQIYIEATSAWRIYDIVVAPKYATINPSSVTYSDSYIYISWTNTRTASCSVAVSFKFVPNPLI